MAEFEYISGGSHDSVYEVHRPAWQRQAACRGLGPEWFYLDPEGGKTRYSWNQIRRVCGRCPVHQQCFEYAIEHEEDGVWAGTNPIDRRVFRKLLDIKLDTPGEKGRVATCGTVGGFEHHRRENEPICDPCRRAHNSQVQMWKAKRLARGG